jgi:hypothetical protein
MYDEHANTVDEHANFMLSERSQMWKGHILYDSIYLKCIQHVNE